MRISLFRSIGANWCGLIIAILVGFFLSPFVVRQLGREVYGIWTIIVSITGQLMVLDLGIRQSLTKYVAQFRVKDDLKEIRELVSSGAAVLFVTALVGLAVIVALTPFFGNWFGIPDKYLAIAKIALILAALDGAIELAFGIFMGVLNGSERYDITNSINALRLLLNAAIVVVLLKLGYGLLAVAGSALLTRVLHRLALGYFSLRELPGLRLTVSAVKKDKLLLVARYGAWMSLIMLASRIIYHTDTLVVGAVIGPAAVTTYAIAILMVDQLRMFTQSTVMILVPRLSALDEMGDREVIQQLLTRGSHHAQLLPIAVGIPIFITGGDFIELWMGPEFRSSAQVLYLLTLPFFFTVPGRVLATFFLATGQHRRNALVLSCEAAMNLLLSILLVYQWGIAGVAVATVVPAIVFSGVILPGMVLRESGLPLFQYLKGAFLRLLPLAVLHAGLLFLLTEWIGTKSWIGFFTVNTLGLALLSLATYTLVFDAEDRGYVRRRLGLDPAHRENGR